MTIKATMICDSISPQGIRLTTLQLRYPKFIHGEFMTHRVFSRNASSSRAIPVERLIKDVIDDPVYPSHWGKNQPGMQANEECTADVRSPHRSPLLGVMLGRDEVWDEARERAIEIAQAFTEAGYHKQIVNRLLEPFCHINVVVTATEWTNFFALRCHKDAQPEMRELAIAISQAMANSQPLFINIGSWHLPYVTERDELDARVRAENPSYQREAICAVLAKISIARCARVSYLTQEGKKPKMEDDLKLYERLVGAVPLHASPAEHQATPDGLRCNDPGYQTGLLPYYRWKHPHLHGNLRGWIQYRKTLPGESQ